MRRPAGPQYVDWGGKLVPRSLVEGWPNKPGACPACGGLGEIPEQVDEDRWPMMVPCHQCRMYCKERQKWVAKKNHAH